MQSGPLLVAVCRAELVYVKQVSGRESAGSVAIEIVRFDKVHLEPYGIHLGGNCGRDGTARIPVERFVTPTTMKPEDTEENMAALLLAIEDISEIVRLKLNRSICQLIADQKKKVRFKDGTHVAQTSTALYVGTLLYQTANRRPEVIRRLNGAADVRRKLDLSWRKAALSTRRKVIMYEALVSAKLLYALDYCPYHKQCTTV